MYNLGIIIGALFFVRWWGPIGLAWGVVLGAAAPFLMQLSGLEGLHYHYQHKISWHHPGVKEIGF
jgi:putative peptidoglycan lipid II flippase